ncbi:MAG: hypothetical protein KAX80_15015, partial [Planctomycetes bacterium]|nr:hypothetical protein [Planctomycetota bacterium]
SWRRGTAVTNDDYDPLREALLSGLEPSDELRERFQRQMAHVIRPTLSGARRVGNVICAAVFLPMSVLFGYVAYFAATAADPGLTLFRRLFMCIPFAAGSLGFLFGAVYAIRELRSGLVALRARQQAMLAVPTALLLLYFTAWLVFWDMFDITAARGVHASTALLFFWIMAVGQVLLFTSRWHREDVLLEQKRTQLEIALLREELAKAAPPG